MHNMILYDLHVPNCGNLTLTHMSDMTTELIRQYNIYEKNILLLFFKKYFINANTNNKNHIDIKTTICYI